MIAGIDDIDVSVVLACHTLDRLDSIKSALASVRKQSLEPRQVIVAVDNNEVLADQLSNEFDWITVVVNRGSPGSSATRNCGAVLAVTRFTAFLDDDETADPDWLLELTQPFCDTDVVGTGGRYEAVWSSGKPSWFPDEFAWVVGGSYLGMPTETTAVRNVWSGNMAVRTDVFLEVGGFRTEFGKHDGVNHPEDTDLCIRMSSTAAAGNWLYIPSAIIIHDVPPGRATFRFFVSRCFAEGGGKALMRQRLKSASSLDVEWLYVRTVARAAGQRLVLFRPTPIVQAMVILAGLASAGVGYVRRQLGEFAMKGART
jgi:GT2 family glycosyltransferase